MSDGEGRRGFEGRGRYLGRPGPLPPPNSLSEGAWDLTQNVLVIRTVCSQSTGDNLSIVLGEYVLRTDPYCIWFTVSISDLISRRGSRRGNPPFDPPTAEVTARSSWPLGAPFAIA